jgi:uncharacterized protein
MLLMRATSNRITVHRVSAALVLLILVMAAGTTAAQSEGKATPEPSGEGAILAKPDRLVTDTAGILSAEEVSSLEETLVGVETRELAQVLVYIVPSLPADEKLEELTLRSVNAWGVGRAGVDDGLVIFVFVADRKVRIELGLGLESAISDEAAGRVIAEIIAPAFRREAYAEGLRGAVQELVRLLEFRASHGQALPP